MDMSNYNSAITITEFEFGNSAESIGQFLESQKDLFHIQIDQFEKIVVTQCKLTGVNPLAQEMAAGALSINIGKRPRDLLNPKAVKYMQSVFSIKDTIGKKDSREISALCGVTVTQVREFFAGQRARVRKFVRLSRDRAVKSDAYQATQDGCSTSYDKSDVCEATQDGCSTNYDPVMTVIDQVPLNTVDPRTCEEAPYSQKEEPIPGVDDSDKLFLESIFTLMKKEETFSGQVKLMEWILQVQNISLLIWFLTKGGVIILATWLSQAATEEQTSVLLVIFKVLCHLPLHKALPEQMSAILQTINRLRFYRMSDISNRAKVLLSRLSKLLFRSQTMKKPSVTISPSDAHKEKQRLNEMLCIEWQSNLDLPEDIFALSVETSGNGTKAEPLQSIKLLQASTDDSSKKHNGGVSSNQKKERRKVQVLLMDQPGRNGTGKSPQAGRAVSSNQGRPMSTDDIQKAKMRAMFMQSKYGKNETSSADKLPISHSNRILSAHNIHVTPKIKIHKRIREDKKPERMVSEITPSKAPMDSEPSSSTKEQTLWEKVNKERIPWNNPPEFIINSEWSVGAGEKSKEVEIQTGRLQREKEIVYQRIQDVPSNPNAPWDLELDYDDSLTPEIPTQQAPDIESADTYASPQNIENDSYVSLPAPTSTENVPGPDLQLLAVLLKNPELVFALTSGQGSNLNSAETVKLLDMIKNSGNGLTGTLNGFEGETKMVEATVTTSLPSPTPSSEPIMSPWRKEPATRDSFPQQVIAMPTLPSSNGFSQPQIPNASNIASQSPQVTINQTPQHPVYNQTPPNHVIIQSPSVTVHQYRPQNNMGVGYASQPQSQHHQETLTNYGQMQNIKPAPLSIVLNTLPLPPMLQTPVYQEPQLLQQPWSGPNHNNYVVFPGNHQPQYTNMYPSNGYVGEHDAEGWSPERSPDYHDQSSFGRNYTDNRRDVGRNRSRRRDRGGNNRRWRDRRN